MKSHVCGCFTMLAALSYASQGITDGVSIDKVYHPYVQLLEREIEYRMLYQQDSDEQLDGQQRHIFGFGWALSDRLFAELYTVGSDSYGNDMDLDAYELELKWQLTEQGEFDNDWGVLFELERGDGDDQWEAATTLIALREWRNWVLTGNFTAIYEWGDDVASEWETAFSGQFRYRYRATFEPAFELYVAQDTLGAGPVLTGAYRLGAGKKLNWELGVVLGLGKETADANWKLNLAYEF